MTGRARELEVVEIIKETADAVSLVFAVPDELVDRFRYRPGQFLTLRVPSEQTGSVARCYSLCSSPHLDDHLIVTVKRVEGGYASNWLCDHAVVGMLLAVLPPSGIFTPRSLDADLLLCAAGSGITPVISIAKSALLAGRGEVVLLYANRDRASVIFDGELGEIAAEFPDRFTVIHWLDDERGTPSSAELLPVLEPFAGHAAYLCGPAVFMDAAREALCTAGVDPAHVHREVYQSLSGNPFDERLVRDDPQPDDDDVAQAVVELDDEQYVLDWPRHLPLLDVLLRNGVDAPFSCREAECSACACTVTDGEVRMLANDTLVDADIAEGITLACQAVPVSDVVHIAYDL